LGAGLLGVGTAFGAAAADAGAFGIVAKGMFSDVTGAQKKLTTATAAYNKATTSAARASALKQEREALAGLTPAEKRLATALTSLSGAWKQLTQSEQGVVGQALAPWMETATDDMGLLKPLITDGADAVGFLGSEAKTALAAPFWKTFFTTLGTTGGAALDAFGTAAGKVGDGLAHLFVTFSPDIQDVLPYITKAGTAFDNWAKSVNDKGLRDFFSKTFSPGNVATLKSDLGDLATFLGNASHAIGNLSPASFTGLNAFLTVLSKLSPDEIIALTAMFSAAKALGGAGNLAKLATGAATLGLPGPGGKEGTGKAGALSLIGGGAALAYIGGNVAGGIA
ncbi:MAG: hypothetical protein ACRDL8_22785, partial [Solirubrobacteraceae bacterium]